MNHQYELGRLAARRKYAEAATGALAGGLLGAALPQVTDSVWERPLRSLGGATLGAVVTRDEDVDPVDAAAKTGLGVYGGGVGGAILGGFGGALLDANIEGPHAKNSLGTLGGLMLGGTLGGVLGGAWNARRAKKLQQPTLEEP